MKKSKMIGTLMTVLLLACPASIMHAQDDIIVTSDNVNNNTNTATSTSTATSNATGGKATATGGNSNATLNYTERTQLPGAPNLVTPSNGTGGVIVINNHLITQSRLSDELAAFPSFSVTQVKTAITFMDKSEGADSWGSVNGRIKVYPVVTNPRQPLPEDDPIYFLDPARVKFSNGFVIGRIIYNGKDKKNPVLFNQFLLRVTLDAASVGANAVVFTEQFHQSSVVTKADGVSVGGFFAKILSCFAGGSVGASGGLTSGSTTEFGVAGIAVTMLYIPNQPCPPVVEKEPCDDCDDLSEVFADLAMYQQKIAGCHFFSADNLSYRVPSGEGNIELYACTRDQKYLRAAEKDLDWALKNYERGSDTRVGKRAVESLQFYRRAIILQATVLEAQGKSHEAQVHAKKYGVEHWGSDFVPARRKK
jgi:hypothetical protein